MILNEHTCLGVKHRRLQNMWTRTLDPKAPWIDCDVVPWVFTHNAVSASYDYMMRASVTSANKAGHVKPYCLFSGDKKSAAAQWLVEQGVATMVLIFHTPAWADKLWKAAQGNIARVRSHSHLGATRQSLVGTYQRIDIPKILIFQQYQMILYTDTDIFFNMPIRLSDITPFKPMTIIMAPTRTRSSAFRNLNAGVMLMNIETLHVTYDSFLNFILASNVAYFGEYGTNDQGAYNTYYAKTIRGKALPDAYNVNTFYKFVNNAKIVHFRGRLKPLDIVQSS